MANPQIPMQLGGNLPGLDREEDLEPGHIDTFDSYETPNLEAFKDEAADEPTLDEGDFDPSLN